MATYNNRGPGWTYYPFPWVTSTAASTTVSYRFPWVTNATTSGTLTGEGVYYTERNAIWSRLTQDPWMKVRQPLQVSAEERQRRADLAQRAREELSRRRLAEQVRMKGAQDRGMALLEMILTPEERVWRDQHPGNIFVRGSDGGMYEIEQTSVHGNIRQVDEHGCVLGRVCVAPQMFDYDAKKALPLADGWIGQYLAIKHNEAEFRARGNWSVRRECAQPNVPVLRPALAA